MISQLLALTTIFGAIVVPPKPGLAQSFGKENFKNLNKHVDLNKSVAKYHNNCAAVNKRVTLITIFGAIVDLLKALVRTTPFSLNVLTLKTIPKEFSSIVNYKAVQCTEVRLSSFLSGGFTTRAVINPPERKLTKHTSVQCSDT